MSEISIPTRPPSNHSGLWPQESGTHLAAFKTSEVWIERIAGDAVFPPDPARNQTDEIQVGPYDEGGDGIIVNMDIETGEV
jgi:hypothetical protein